MESSFESRLLNVREAARFLSISTSTPVRPKVQQLIPKVSQIGR